VTSAAGPGRLRWLFLQPTLARPTGGDIALFEMANAIARRGDLVQIVHVPLLDTRVRDLSEVPWLEFEPSVEHHFATDLDPERLPAADVVVYGTKLLMSALAPDAGTGGGQLVSALEDPRSRSWLPVLFLQGLGVFAPEVEALARRLPGPKVCVGSWLADLLVDEGVAAVDVVHIPNGVDPRMFRVHHPIEGRAPHVSMNFDPHPVKGGEPGLAAIEALHRRAAVAATVFGTRPPPHPPAPGVAFVLSPARTTIAEIYNASSVFLQPSRQEGFGMCAVEAMASGCALVSTANGGSADYAFDGETALVCGPDEHAMLDALHRLVGDDPLRIRLATAGARHVERFRWSVSAERLSALVAARLAAGA